MDTIQQMAISLLCGLGVGWLPITTQAGENSETQKPAEDSEVLLNENFSRGLEHWVWEGPPGAVVEVEDGALLLDPREANHRPPGTEGINLWHREPLQGDWAIEVDLEPLNPKPLDGENCNLLFMLNYRYQDPELDVIKDASLRTGHYALLHGASNRVQTFEETTGIKYRPMRGYTLTYYRLNPEGDPPYMMVVRRNPGFHLVHRKIQTAEDQWAFRHTVRIERRGSSLRLFQNDKLALETFDSSKETPPNDGHLGIRTWMTRVKIYSVRAYRLEPVSP